MTQEILQALRNIEDKIMREPVAFDWTPSMDAIWPKDMRPTMSGLLAIWAAMRDAAVYETSVPGPTEPVADAEGWIANENLAKPEWLKPDTMIDVVMRWSETPVHNIRADAIRWDECFNSTVIRWRLA